jgi:hypothetical protein
MATSKQSSENEGVAPDEPVVVAGIEAPHLQTAEGLGNSQPILPATGAPNAQMVKVKEVATGRVFAAWPIDARELVTHPSQDHVYATAEEGLTPFTVSSGGNPIPVAPADGTAPVLTAPVASQAPISSASVDPLTATAQLSDMSKSELQKLASTAGVDPQQSKAGLVESLQPHVSAGTIALDGSAGVGLPSDKR